MSTESISQNAEKTLLDQLDKSDNLSGLLHLNCAKVGFEPDQSRVESSVKTSLTNNEAIIYYFEDGDIVILCDSSEKIVLDGLRRSLQECLHVVLDAKLYTFHDVNKDRAALKQLCQEKISNIPKVRAEKAQKLLNDLFVCTAQQKDAFYQASYSRKFRSSPHILLVEDQAFSMELLRNILSSRYTIHSSYNARTAWDIYLDCAPDIVLLDIEMPGIDGHELAKAMTSLDPQAHVIMVTANHYAQDVEKAKANGVKGYVAKPYNKQKILDCIEKFQAKHTPLKRKRS